MRCKPPRKQATEDTGAHSIGAAGWPDGGLLAAAARTTRDPKKQAPTGWSGVCFSESRAVLTARSAVRSAGGSGSR